MDVGAAACVGCPAGKASGVLGADSYFACNTCEEGKWAGKGTAACEWWCDVGQVFDGSGCIPCPSPGGYTTRQA